MKEEGKQENQMNGEKKTGKMSPSRATSKPKTSPDVIAARSVHESSLTSELLGASSSVKSPNTIFIRYVSAPLKHVMSLCWKPFHKVLDQTAFTRMLVVLVSTTWLYQYSLFEVICLGRGYDDSVGRLYPSDLWARVQVFSVGLIFRLWDKPHYRCASFQQDMKDNLRNVAIPGTGIPLSIFCYQKVTAMWFVVCVLPFVCLMGAINKANKTADGAARDRSNSTSGNSVGGKNGKSSSIASKPALDSSGEYFDRVAAYFVQHMLHPDDWFSFWRLNCRLASWHSSVQGSSQYALEDKWTFLRDGEKAGVPVSPFLSDVDALVVKHKSIEGGMGIHFFDNATAGGDWILQKRIENAKWLNDILPAPAPLSTMRIITFSTWSLQHPSGPPNFAQDGKVREDDDMKEDDPLGAAEEDASVHVEALSAVLRLGRKGASTDHSSVMFDVDAKTGRVRKGVSNAQWYKLGPLATTTCPWLPEDSNLDIHPDSGVRVSGYVVPGMDVAIKTVVSSHFKLLAEVPIVGWDVCFTPHGIVLLEVNLSCNFFRGSFAVAPYLANIEQYFKTIEKLEKEKQKQK